MSQTTEIERYLKKGFSLTPLRALRLFGCFRLAARINELRNSGLAIDTDIVKLNDKHVARYTYRQSKNKE